MSLAPNRNKALTGAPRWMVTFADLMALLFALFVLLLSFADFDPTKFKQNAGSLAKAFNVGDLVVHTGIDPRTTFPQPDQPEPTLSESTSTYLVSVQRQKLLSELNSVMLAEIERGMVELESRENAVIVRFPDKAAFSSGSVRMAPSILPTLNKVGDIIAQLTGKIEVAGHTDNTPISTSQFDSNWELSAGRAAAVVRHLLVKKRIQPGRVTVQGFADTKPLADNNTRANRAKNRRVEISIEVTATRGR